MGKKKYYRTPLNDVNWLKRLFAYVLDYYFGLLICSLPIVLANGILNHSDKMQTNLYLFENQPVALYIVAAFSFLLGYVYYIHIPLRIWNGQTVAKKLFHFKIVKDNGDPVNLKTLVLRHVLGMMLIEGAVLCCTSILAQLLSFTFAINFIDSWLHVGMVVTIISGVWMLLNNQHKMFHDYIAKTIVTSDSYGKDFI